MPDSEKYHFAKTTHVFLLCAFFYALSAFSSCTNIALNKNNPLLDSAFKKIDSSAAIAPFLYTKADMDYMDGAFENAKWAGKIDIANKYTRKISYYRGTGTIINQDSILIYADSIIALLYNYLNDKKFTSLYLKAIFTKADVYFRLKNYTEAIRNYTVAKLALTQYVKDSTALYPYYAGISQILYAQRKFEKAAEAYRTKVNLASVSDPGSFSIYLEIQENLDNVGICYSRLRLNDSAMFYYNAALQYINTNQYRFPSIPNTNFDIERAVGYSNIADVLFNKGDMKGAESFFRKSAEGIKTYDDKGFIADVWLSLANTFLHSNQIKKAGTILMSLRQTVDSASFNTTTTNFYKYSADYYSKSGQFVQANYYLNKAYNIKDSIEKRDKQFNATDFQKEFENTEQRAANQLLQKDNAIKNSYLLMIVLGSVMALVIIFMVWKNLNHKLVYVKKLTLLNEEMYWKNDDLHKTLDSVEQSYNENNRVMRVVAHNLKNPVSAIRTLVFSLLKKEQTPLNKQSLQLVEETCIESIGLINDLLNNKRTLTEISKELVDMGKLIEQCSELFQVKADEKNQHLKVQVDYPVMMLNRQKIWRVISNIVNNAIKFSPANTDIMIRLERKDGSVLLSVKDNGIGIPLNLHDKIFASGIDISRTGTAGEESYGLGLAISKKIIEEHAGNFWVESEAGKGSIFYVELPYHVN